MASNYTENCGLCQWEATDQVLRTEFNEDNQKIDAALKNQSVSLSNLSDQLENKANTATVNNLSSTVSQKADRSELEAEKNAREAKDAELEERAGMHLINRVILEQPTEWPKLDLSGIDWNQWATVRILMKPVIDDGDHYRISFNSSSSMSLGSTITGHFNLLLFPTFDQDMCVCGFRWPTTYKEYIFFFDTKFQNLTNIEFGTSENSFHQGTVMEIWGQK